MIRGGGPDVPVLEDDMTKSNDGARFIDLRSDTVTRPTPAMYQAMAKAPLGDDVYGGDPTVGELEARGAERLGKEAALFFPSGTQANLAALLSHCQRGDEYIAGDGFHIACAEAGGAAVLGGIAPCALPTPESGAVPVEDLEAAIKPDDFHYPVTRLLCLENTYAGRVVPLAHQQQVVDLARERGLAVHLDGARLMNAAVALGVPATEVAAGADSVSLCLSKGLGAPVGSLLAGKRTIVERARRIRKMLGGGLRQSGLLAACGLVALDRHVERLAEDHANARTLAEGLAAIEELSVDLDAVQTNMVFVRARRNDLGPLRDALAAQGILLGRQDPCMRLVVHLDVSASDVQTVIAAAERHYLALRPKVAVGAAAG